MGRHRRLCDESHARARCDGEGMRAGRAAEG